MVGCSVLVKMVGWCALVEMVGLFDWNNIGWNDRLEC